jgi:hypothetical protein
MRTPDKSLVAAIDEYKREAWVTKDDRRFLDRLRDHPITAKYRSNPNNAHLVDCLVRLRRIAKSMVKLPEGKRQHAQYVEKIRNAIELLRREFHLNRPDLEDGARALKRGLAWVDGLYGKDRALAEFSPEDIDIMDELPEGHPWPTLNRQPDEQNLFIRMLTKEMQNMGGKPRYGDVAQFNDIAFETETTPGRVRRLHKRRSGQLTEK